MPKTFGRSSSCDVVLNDPTVSRRHFQIEAFGQGSYLLTDLGSTHGTFVNGQRVRQQQIGPDDLIRAGNLVISDWLGRMNNPHQYRDFGPSPQAPSPAPPRGGGGRIRVGRSSHNDVVLGSQRVSSNHAELSRDAAGHTLLTDLGSTNGTYVNGQRIQGSVTLRPGDVVKLADTPLDWQNAGRGQPGGTIPDPQLGAGSGRPAPAPSPARPVSPVGTPQARSGVNWALLTPVLVLVLLVGVGAYFYFDLGGGGKSSSVLNSSKTTQEVMEAAVVIKAGGQSFGSGFVLKGGEVITNFHVIAGVAAAGYKMNDVEVVFENGNRFDMKGIVSYSEDYDLIRFALGGGSTAQLPYLQLAEETVTNENVGQPVRVIGTPHGLDFTMTSGTITAVRSISETMELISGEPSEGTIDKDYENAIIQIDAAVSPGNSGGPLLNEAGEVIGVVTLKHLQADDANFALNSKLINIAMKRGPKDQQPGLLE